MRIFTVEMIGLSLKSLSLDWTFSTLDYDDNTTTSLADPFDERRPNEYYTADFGIIYRNSISYIAKARYRNQTS